jgi:TonB family protein
MIASWMIYAMLVGFCLAAAAHASEVLLRMYRRPARWVWTLALLGSVGVPLLQLMLPGWFAGSSTIPVLDSGARIVIGTLAPNNLVGVDGGESVAPVLDRILATLWIGISIALALLVGWTTLRLAQERKEWHRKSVGGVTVLVSGDVGPAVVGLRDHSIVVPTWVLELEESLQRLVVQHEGEHVNAGDLHLLLGGLVLAVLVPWNPAMWWQLKRLRLAVEADCDRRVLLDGANAHSYGSLLLSIGSRSLKPRFAALALSERKSPLIRRIEIMTSRPRKHIGRAALALVAGAGFVILACETPTPELRTAAQPTAPVQASVQSDAELVVFAESAVDKLPERVSSPPMEYPRLLQQAGIGGLVWLSGIVGLDGRIEEGSVEVISSTDERFDRSAARLLQRSVFKPGEIDGRPVRVKIEMPVQFTLFVSVTPPASESGDMVHVATVPPRNP